MYRSHFPQSSGSLGINTSIIITHTEFIQRFTLRVGNTFTVSFQRRYRRLVIIQSETSLSPNPFHLRNILFSRILLQIRFCHSTGLLIISFHQINLSYIIRNQCCIYGIILQRLETFQRLVVAFLHIINISQIINSVILIQWAYLFQQGKPYSRFTQVVFFQIRGGQTHGTIISFLIRQSLQITRPEQGNGLLVFSLHKISRGNQ